MTPRIQPIAIPTPFPVGPVNAYLLPDDPVTLVDAGVKTPAARDAIAAAFAAAGLSLGALQRIILTHGHTDHMGLAAEIAARTGAAVLAHPDDAPKFRGERLYADNLLDTMRRHGAPEALGPAVLAALRALRGLIDPLTQFDPLADGMDLAFTTGTLRVLHTPGHSAGHVCLAGDGFLIAGDVLLEEISPNPLLEFTAGGERVRTLPLLLASLRRLHALNPAVVYPGHGDPFGPAAPRIERVLAHHADRLAHVHGLLDDTPQTAAALADTLFAAADPMNRLLALSEVIGHLDLLVAAGRAEEVTAGGRVAYRRR